MSDNLATRDVTETAMVDLAYDLLVHKGEPMIYQDIMNEVSRMKGFTEEEVEKYIAQLYTEINIDGRFTCVGRGLWGLKDWYPVEQTTESAVAANMKDDYLEDELAAEDLFAADPVALEEEDPDGIDALNHEDFPEDDENLDDGVVGEEDAEEVDELDDSEDLDEEEND